MNASNVIFNGRSIMDITDTTATPETVKTGMVFYGANGDRLIGNMSGGDGEEDAKFLEYYYYTTGNLNFIYNILTVMNNINTNNFDNIISTMAYESYSGSRLFKDYFYKSKITKYFTNMTIGAWTHLINCVVNLKSNDLALNGNASETFCNLNMISPWLYYRSSAHNNDIYNNLGLNRNQRIYVINNIKNYCHFIDTSSIYNISIIENLTGNNINAHRMFSNYQYANPRTVCLIPSSEFNNIYNMNDSDLFNYASNKFDIMLNDSDLSEAFYNCLISGFRYMNIYLNNTNVHNMFAYSQFSSSYLNINIYADDNSDISTMFSPMSFSPGYAINIFKNNFNSNYGYDQHFIMLDSSGPRCINLIGNNCNYSELLRFSYNNANGIDLYNNFLYIKGNNLNLKNFISVRQKQDGSSRVDLNLNLHSSYSNIIKIIGNDINASNFASDRVCFNTDSGSSYPLMYFEGNNINFSNAKINIHKVYSGQVNIIINATNMVFENSFLNRDCQIYVNDNKLVNLAGIFGENTKSWSGWTYMYVDNVYRFYRQNFFNRYNTTPLSFQVSNRNYAVCYRPNIILYGNFA